MSTPIRIDPETGLKVFSTRASKATDRIQGRGYAVVTDESGWCAVTALKLRPLQCRS